MYRLGTHSKAHNPIPRSEADILNKWRELYKHDKSSAIYSHEVVIFPIDIYSLKQDRERANRERQYFIAKL